MSKIVEQRILDRNGGVVVTIVYDGSESMEINYETSKGLKNTVIAKNLTGGVLLKGDICYGHIDDVTNELLVLSKEKFPY